MPGVPQGGVENEPENEAECGTAQRVDICALCFGGHLGPRRGRRRPCAEARYGIGNPELARSGVSFCPTPLGRWPTGAGENERDMRAGEALPHAQTSTHRVSRVIGGQSKTS